MIPVVDEPIDLFRDVLSRIVQQTPTEVLVVINGPRNQELEAVCAEFPLVNWEWTSVAGKRNAPAGRYREGESERSSYLSIATHCGQRGHSLSS